MAFSMTETDRPRHHRTKYEPDGSVTEWESHDGISWAMTKQTYPEPVPEVLLREARADVDPEQRLTLKVWETPLGYWAYGVVTGDGTKPGSLMAAAGGMRDPESAVTEGLEALQRRIKIQACDHEWRPWLGVSDSKIDYCSKCGIVKGFSLGS